MEDYSNNDNEFINYWPNEIIIRNNINNSNNQNNINHNFYNPNIFNFRFHNKFYDE